MRHRIGFGGKFGWTGFGETVRWRGGVQDLIEAGKVASGVQIFVRAVVMWRASLSMMWRRSARRHLS